LNSRSGGSCRRGRNCKIFDDKANIFDAAIRNKDDIRDVASRGEVKELVIGVVRK